jgi:hypothetical protein
VRRLRLPRSASDRLPPHQKGHTPCLSSQQLAASPLLVSQKSAVDRDYPAVSIATLSAAFPRGLTLSGLRQDRILKEATESADPLRLMRLFGITEQTAMRYITGPPRTTAKLPR